MMVCTLHQEFNEALFRKIWNSIDLALAFAVPLAIVLPCNVLMVVSIARRAAWRRKSQSTVGKISSTTIMLTVNSIVFVLLTAPVGIELALQSYGILDINNPYTGFLYYLSHVLCNLNSSLNFILYCVSGRRFRRVLRELWCKPSCCTGTSHGTTQTNRCNMGEIGTPQTHSITLNIETPYIPAPIHSAEINHVMGVDDIPFQTHSADVSRVMGVDDIPFQTHSADVNRVMGVDDIPIQTHSAEVNRVMGVDDIPIQTHSTEINRVMGVDDIPIQTHSAEVNHTMGVDDIPIQTHSAEVNHTMGVDDIPIQTHSAEINRVMGVDDIPIQTHSAEINRVMGVDDIPIQTHSAEVNHTTGVDDVLVHTHSAEVKHAILTKDIPIQIISCKHIIGAQDDHIQEHSMDVNQAMAAHTSWL